MVVHAIHAYGVTENTEKRNRYVGMCLQCGGGGKSTALNTGVWSCWVGASVIQEVFLGHRSSGVLPWEKMERIFGKKGHQLDIAPGISLG